MTALDLLKEAKRLQQKNEGNWYALDRIAKREFPELEKAEELLVKSRDNLDKAIEMAGKS